jgi:hypothetical protein
MHTTRRHSSEGDVAAGEGLVCEVPEPLPPVFVGVGVDGCRSVVPVSPLVAAPVAGEAACAFGADVVAGRGVVADSGRVMVGEVGSKAAADFWRGALAVSGWAGGADRCLPGGGVDAGRVCSTDGSPAEPVGVFSGAVAACARSAE